MSNSITWWVIALLASLTLLIEAPLIAFPMYAGDAYRGINVAPFGNDERHYLSRGKEVLEGKKVGQPYLSEGKDLPDSFQSDTEYVLMSPLRWLGFSDVNVVTAFNVLNTIGVFLMLLLIYLFVYQLSRNKVLSVAAALFAIGGSVLLQNGTVIAWFLKGNPIIYGAPNIFGRSTDPYTALVPFFAFLILTYKAAFARFEGFSRETWKPYAYVAGAGILLGILFYDYFYAWTFTLAFLGCLFLSSLAWRRWSSVIVACAIGAIGVVVAIPMLIGFIKLFTSSLGEQFAFFFMAIHDRFFIGSMTGLATLILFAVYWYFRRDDANNFFILAIIAAGWVALEQQLITGRAVQYGHYYWYFVVPLSVVVALYMVYKLIPPSKEKWGTWMCVAAIAVALLNTAAGQYKSFFNDLHWKMREQDYAPLMAVLRNAPEGVVLADPSGEPYPFMVTMFTNNDLFWLPAAITSGLSLDRLEEALLVYLYINDESRRDAHEYLSRALATSTANSYTEMYEELEAFRSGIPMQEYWKVAFPHTAQNIQAARSSFLPAIAQAYEDRASTPEKVRQILEARNVRYILWDRRTNPEWDISTLAPLEIMATSTDLTLYSISTIQ